MALAAAAARAPLLRPSQAPASLLGLVLGLLLAPLMGLQPITTDLMLTALPALAADLQAGLAHALVHRHAGHLQAA